MNVDINFTDKFYEFFTVNSKRLLNQIKGCHIYNQLGTKGHRDGRMSLLND